MTRKEEILLFIEENITKFNFLKAIERIVDTNVESVVEVNDAGHKTFAFKKDEIAPFIDANYNDDLIGKPSNDKTTTQLLYWYVVDRPVEYFE